MREEKADVFLLAGPPKGFAGKRKKPRARRGVQRGNPLKPLEGVLLPASNFKKTRGIKKKKASAKNGATIWGGGLD